MCELDPFRGTRRAGGVNDGEEIIGLDAGYSLPCTTITTLTEFLSPNLKIAEFVKMDVGVIGSPPSRFTRIHQYDMTKSGNSVSNRGHLGKHGIILNESNLNVGMIKDVGNFLLRHIGGTRNIGRPAKLDGGIRQNPLEAIIGENRDMIA
jgi:hypothetical protein